jgi:hypothetical protein
MFQGTVPCTRQKELWDECLGFLGEDSVLIVDVIGPTVESSGYFAAMHEAAHVWEATEIT